MKISNATDACPASTNFLTLYSFFFTNSSIIFACSSGLFSSRGFKSCAFLSSTFFWPAAISASFLDFLSLSFSASSGDLLTLVYLDAPSFFSYPASCISLSMYLSCTSLPSLSQTLPSSLAFFLAAVIA